MPTLILTPRMTEDSIALWRAAGRLGWTVERLPGWRLPAGFAVEGEVVLYVEALTAPMMAEVLGLRLIEPPIDWLPKLPFEYRQRDIKLMTLAEARGLKESMFIKPPNDKCFTAAIYRGGELPTDFPDEMPVLVSEIVFWEVEFRCFVLDRQVQTFSAYLRNGQLQREAGFPHSETEEAELLRFIDRFLSDERIEFPKATVVDAGVIRGQGWAVIEQNAAWGSGIYGCDATRVLEVLRHSAEAATPKM